MSGHIGVKRLAVEHREWLTVVKAALRASKKFKSYGSDDFAGSWVLDEAKKEGIDWFPNLRILVRYGILKHLDTTRGGRRAYYTMPAEEEVEKALYELGMIEPLKKLESEKGREVLITIKGLPKGDRFEKAMAGWKGLIDCEKLIEDIYNDRLLRTRPEV